MVQFEPNKHVCNTQIKIVRKVEYRDKWLLLKPRIHGIG